MQKKKKKPVKPAEQGQNSKVFPESLQHYIALQEQTIPLVAVDQAHSDTASLSSQIVERAPLQ